MADGERKHPSVASLKTNQEVLDIAIEHRDFDEEKEKYCFDDDDNTEQKLDTLQAASNNKCIGSKCKANAENSHQSPKALQKYERAKDALDSDSFGNPETVESSQMYTPNENELENCFYNPAFSSTNFETNDILKTSKDVELNCQQITEVRPVTKPKRISKKVADTKSSVRKKHLESTLELELDGDTICGLGSFKPQWLQAWATPRCYLALYSIIGVVQGSYYSYFIGMISTLEKRYAFKSKVTGSIMMIDEITPLFLGVLIGYFGGKAHRPRLLALGMFLASVCCFVTATPYFIYGTAQHLVSGVVKNGTGPEMCDYKPKKEECDEDDRPPTMSAVVCLLMGSFLKGFGNLAYYAIGITYLDDNAKKKNTPIYFALSSSLRLLGPTIGFLMSSYFLNFYENPFVDPGFSPEDPRWIGAWWMGFVFQGTVLLIVSSPIVLFPRRLPSMAIAQVINPDEDTFGEKMRGLWIGLKRLGRNPLYICITAETIFSILGSFGYYVMLPKYMENQFRLNSSDASLYSGPAGLIAIQIFTIIGGVAIWKCRPSPRKLILGVMFSEILGAIGFLLLMIPSCHNLHMAGATRELHSLELVNECNKDCLCTTNVYTPLCGPDEHSTYFSPCYAGCSAMTNISNIETFENCSCIQNSIGSFAYTQNMTKGYCATDYCWDQAVIYIIMIPILQGLTSIFRVAHTMILLRSVSPPDKSFALGTFESVLCIFGFIPYPVIYGALVDSACLVWERSCGKTGNCWLYDNDKFKTLLHGVSAAFSFAAVLCSIGMLMLSPRLKNLYDDEDYIREVKENAENKTKDTKLTEMHKKCEN